MRRFQVPKRYWVLTIFFAGLLVNFNSVKADWDFEITDFAVNPRNWQATLAPGQVYFTLKNNGPDDWTFDFDAPLKLINLYIYSSMDDSVGEDDKLIYNFNFPVTQELQADQELKFEFNSTTRSRLMVPARTEPYYWYAKLEAFGFTDLLDENNIAFAPLPTSVTPVGSGIWATFSAPEIITSNMDIISEECFAYNFSYGNSWRIACNDGDTGFNAVFQSEEVGDHELSVTHLSSGFSECPGGGYSPVTITINNENIVTNYDPAENHDGTHDYVTDTWIIPLKKGENILSWFGEITCTHYWIQHLEITPLSKTVELSISIHPDGAAELTINGPLNSTITVESSQDLQTWEKLESFQQTKEEQVVAIGNTLHLEKRFFRAKAE